MTKSVISSINLCPINFKAFGAINRITSNIEASLLYSKIFFHQKNSVIHFDEKTWIIRSRQELASWYLLSEKKIDSLLSLLFKKGLLEKKIRLWKGKRHLMLHAKPIIEEVPVNHKMLEFLLKKLGSISSVTVFAKIAFHYNNSSILHENKKWCSIKKQHFSEWSNMSLRKLDSVFEDLTKMGLILKKNFLWQGKRQLHFHLPDFAIDIISQEINIKFQLPVACTNYMPVQNSVQHDVAPTAQESIEQGRGEVERANALKCRPQSAKMGISIIERTKTKKTNNNTVPQSNITRTGDISLMTSTLSFRQERYLKAALENTINKSQVNVSNKAELFEELKFSVSNIEQHKSVHSFPHAVSRCMKIVAQSNWRTPKGFYNYSSIGKFIKEKTIMRDTLWDRQKNEEKNITQNMFSNILNKQPEINSQATEQGVRLAKQVLLLKYTENTVLASAMINQIHHLISQGANGKEISEILRNCIF